MINKNGHWTYENITLTIPDEGSEGYIENNRGKITYKIYFVITSILKSNPDKKERKIFYSFLYWGNSNSKYVVLPHFWITMLHSTPTKCRFLTKIVLIGSRGDKNKAQYQKTKYFKN